MTRKREQTVFIAGHRGMVGSAILRKLRERGYGNILTSERGVLDLTRQEQVEAYLTENPVEEIYIAAARVGGIHANDTYPADFIYQNLMIECNLIHAAHHAGVERILFLGSACIYPRLATQPMAEDALLEGKLEPTNEPYAIAKIAGIKLCESYNRQYGRDYRSVMPNNLYGPGDNYHSENSHVIPALIRRFHEARQTNASEVVIWGSGKPLREFLHVDDAASACIHVMELDQEELRVHTQPMLSHVNIGSGEECTIRNLAEQVAEVTDYRGRIVFDISRPDGAPRKLLDTSLLRRLGWRASIGLHDGLRDAYSWYLEHIAVTEI